MQQIVDILRNYEHIHIHMIHTWSDGLPIEKETSIFLHTCLYCSCVCLWFNMLPLLKKQPFIISPSSWHLQRSLVLSYFTNHCRNCSTSVSAKNVNLLGGRNKVVRGWELIYRSTSPVGNFLRNFSSSRTPDCCSLASYGQRNRQFSSLLLRTPAAGLSLQSNTAESPEVKKRKMNTNSSITTVQKGSLNKLDFRIYYRKFEVLNKYNDCDNQPKQNS